ncbi:hypothetical protein ILYODFUR_025450 [Ilyodon furcidens]|uniref:Inositol monophosphatase 1 n=1 Tax=Ilyodon furcidens TaxID=33524 RepID=A0ABV0UWF9_9TELE
MTKHTPYQLVAVMRTFIFANKLLKKKKKKLILWLVNTEATPARRNMSADTKIAELLTELHQLIKQTQEERSRSEHNLLNIQKTHERMQTENKTSPYYRTKLRGLYTTAKADAEAECSILRHALDKIAEIKSLLEERRIAAKMAGVYSDSDPPRKTMRRGVLMTLLQQSAMTLPLWIGKPGERYLLQHFMMDPGQVTHPALQRLAVKGRSVLTCFKDFVAPVACVYSSLEWNIRDGERGKSEELLVSATLLVTHVEVGVVYSCLEDKMFTARRGKGAFCNGEPLQVSDQTDIHQSIIATEFGSSRDPEAVDKIFCSLRNILNLPVHGVRGAGTAAINMCLVASGCVEAYYEIGIHVWDVAAGSLVVSEAGGVLMDVEGADVDLMSRRIVAANNRTIAEIIVKEITPFGPIRDDAPPQKH